MSDKYKDLPSNFDNLKYGDLQRYAKKFGIKANLKAAKLIEALTDYVARNCLVDSSSQKATVVRRCEEKREAVSSEESRLETNSPSDEKYLKTLKTTSQKKFLSLTGEQELADSKDIAVAVRANIMNKEAEEDYHENLLKDSVVTESPDFFACNAKAINVSRRVRNNTLIIDDDDDELMNQCEEMTSNGLTSATGVNTFDPTLTTDVPKTSQIPRLSMRNNRSSTVKPYTAQYWAKIHKRQFDQLDSLDVYVAKKAKRALSLHTHANAHVTRRKESGAQQNNDTGATKRASIFVPTVFSTTKMNTNFSEMFENQNPSLVKKKNLFSSTPQMKISETTRKSMGTSSSVTPFAAGRLNSAQKLKFDLQASLARPMTWKPYVGKLKESYANDLRQDIKNPPIKTREDRRKEMIDARARKRTEQQCNRRRITRN